MRQSPPREHKGREGDYHAPAKSAFQHMMDEIDNSDSEDEFFAPSKASSSHAGAFSPKPQSLAESKASSASSPSSRAAEKEPVVSTGYEVTSKDLEIERFGAGGFEGLPRNGDDQGYTLEALRLRLTRVVRRGDAPVLCYVERDRAGLNRLNPVYRLYLEAPLGSHRPATFLCSAKKQSGSKTSYYLLSIEMNPTDRGSDKLLGKLRGNAIGSHYMLYDAGLAPEKTVSPSMVRQELAMIQFNFDSFGPGTIQVWIPSMNAGGGSTTWKPMSKTETIAHCVEHGETRNLVHLRNKVPKWDEAHGGHVLNFHGRVTESSVKNFQICVQDDEEVSLQFGRVGKHKFTMDVSAFAVCVASMDGKIADRKGYEMIKRLGANKAPGEHEAGQRGDLRDKQTSQTPSMQYLRDKFRRSFKS